MRIFVFLSWALAPYLQKVSVDVEAAFQLMLNSCSHLLQFYGVVEVFNSTSLLGASV